MRSPPLPPCPHSPLSPPFTDVSTFPAVTTVATISTTRQACAINTERFLIYNVISKPPLSLFTPLRPFPPLPPFSPLPPSPPVPLCYRCRRNDPCHIFHISHCLRRSPRGRYTQSAKCVKVMLSYKNKILSYFFHPPLIATCSAFSADSAAFAATRQFTAAYTGMLRRCIYLSK